MINPAHGSLYMVERSRPPGWWRGDWSLLCLSCSRRQWRFTGLFGMLLEILLLRTLYARDHLSQVLATFALIPHPQRRREDGLRQRPAAVRAGRAGRPVQLLPGLPHPSHRLLIIGVGLVLALALWALVQKTRLGALVPRRRFEPRDDRAMGVNVTRLFTWSSASAPGFARWRARCSGPLLAVQVGMGENILILAFVVVVIGGIGSIRGALVGAVLVGSSTRSAAACCHCCALPAAFTGGGAGAGGWMAVYVFMAAVLALAPRACSRCALMAAAAYRQCRGRLPTPGRVFALALLPLLDAWAWFLPQPGHAHRSWSYAVAATSLNLRARFGGMVALAMPPSSAWAPTPPAAS